MIYILSFVICSVIFFFGIAYGISRLHTESEVKPGLRFKAKPPRVNTRAVISVSFILPLSVFALLFLSFPTALLAGSLIREGHRLFALSTVLLPSVCFLAGYSYFKRMLRF